MKKTTEQRILEAQIKCLETQKAAEERLNNQLIQFTRDFTRSCQKVTENSKERN